MMLTCKPIKIWYVSETSYFHVLDCVSDVKKVLKMCLSLLIFLGLNQPSCATGAFYINIVVLNLVLGSLPRIIFAIYLIQCFKCAILALRYCLNNGNPVAFLLCT